MRGSSASSLLSCHVIVAGLCQCQFVTLIGLLICSHSYGAGDNAYHKLLAFGSAWQPIAAASINGQPLAPPTALQPR